MTWRVQQGVVACVMGVAAATGGAAEWRAHGLVQLQLDQRVTPATGERREKKVLGIAPVGEKRYLVLMDSTRMTVSPWSSTEELTKEKQENLSVAARHIKNRESQVLLGLVNERGKLVAESVGQDEIQGSVGNFANSWSVPLVMDQASTCQYAFLDAPGARLFCFDLSLGFEKKLTIPLHEVGPPGIWRDGITYTVVFFGRRHSQPPGVEKPEDKWRLSPSVPESLGLVWQLGEDAPRPLPVSVDELLHAVQAAARDSKGKDVRLRKESLGIVPVATTDPGDRLGVVVHAVAAPVYDSEVKFEGVRLFFRTTLGPFGMGQVEQLPLWVAQEAREQPEVEAKAGVLRLPAFSRPNRLAAYHLRNNRLGIFLEAGYKTPQPDGSYHPRLWDVGKYFAIFAGSQLATLMDLDEEALGAAGEALSTSQLLVHPVTLEAMVGPDRFAFRTICKEKRGREWARRPCLAILELAP